MKKTSAPSHNLDTSTGFKVLSEKPWPQYATYGEYKIAWRRGMTAWGASTVDYSVMDTTGNTWSLWTSYWWKIPGKDLVEKEIKKVRDVWRQERAAKLAKERIVKNRQEAQDKGISVEELMAMRVEARQEKAAEKDLLKQIDRTCRLVKAGPKIRCLYEDLADLLKRIEEGQAFDLRHVDTGIQKLEEAQKIVSKWRKTGYSK